MHKVISLPNITNQLNIVYENTVKSLKALWFYVEQLKLPTLIILFPMPWYQIKMM